MDAHAIALLALWPLTTVLCVCLRRKPTFEQWIVALPLAILLFCGSGAFVHMCDEGQPTRHTSMAALSVLALWLCVDKLRWRLPLMGLVVALACVLGMQYVHWVHTPEVTGNPKLEVPREPVELREALRSIDDSRAYAEGWLSDSELADDLPREARRFEAERRGPVGRYWHSWLTLLYRRNEQRLEIWYPGGKPSDAADRIEWRERPLERRGSIAE